MIELAHVKTAFRATLFTGLLIIYSVTYMEPAVKQFAKKSKTITQKSEEITQPELPVLVLCPDPPFKKSFFKQFGNKSLGAEKYFWSFDVHWKMLENYNSTAMDVYMNMSYQLGLDWNIIVPKLEKYVFTLLLSKLLSGIDVSPFLTQSIEYTQYCRSTVLSGSRIEYTNTVDLQY